MMAKIAFNYLTHVVRLVAAALDQLSRIGGAFGEPLTDGRTYAATSEVLQGRPRAVPVGNFWRVWAVQADRASSLLAMIQGGFSITQGELSIGDGERLSYNERTRGPGERNWRRMRCRT